MSEMINPNVFSDYRKLATHKWRHTLRLRELFADEPTHASLDALCHRTVSEIDRVIRHEKVTTDSDESGYFIGQLESLKSDFNVLIGSTDMCVGDVVEEFDYRLEELYDLGDRKIQLRDGRLQKFAWIG